MTLEEAQKNAERDEKINQKKEYLDEKVGRIAWKVFMIAVVVGFIITRFIAPVYASGESMMPTIKDGSLILCNCMVKNYKTDDIVVISLWKTQKVPASIIKRIVAVPGDSLEIIDGILYVNGIKETRGFDVMEDPGIVTEKIVLGVDEYFVLGDNRNHSSDSRRYGIIQKSMIKGVLTEKCIETSFHLH